MATNRKCTVCHKSHSTPNSYMLTCKTCKLHWHHMCHEPLITEAELIGLVSASTRKSQFGSLETWLCRSCKNRASASAEPSTSPSPLPASRAPSVPIVLDTTPAEQVGRIASKQVRGWPNASSSRSASKLPAQGTSATRLSSEAAVIELLDDSDDDIVEVNPTPGPPRETLRTVAQSSKTIHTPPETEGRGDINIRPGVYRMPSATHSVSKPFDNPSTKEGRTGQRNSVSMQVEKISSAVNLARTMPARSRRSPSAGPSQPRLPVPTPMQIPMIPATAGSSSTPDFRQLIATMRSKGQLKPPPSYVYTSQPHVADTDPYASPVGVSAPDSDIEMADAHEYDHDHAMEPSPAPAQGDPDDLEDMYADLVKKEEPVDAPFLRDRTTRSRGSDETKNNLPGWIRGYEETEEDDSWTTAFQERAERVSMRKATGVRPPRKRQALGNRNKRESFEVIRRSAIPAEVNPPQSPQQRWTAGMLELERLFE